MISKIYDSNKILFKIGKRKGNTKGSIQNDVDGMIRNEGITKLKKKKKKVNTFNENMLEMYEKRREKRRNEYKPKK